MLSDDFKFYSGQIFALILAIIALFAFNLTTEWKIIVILLAVLFMGYLTLKELHKNYINVSYYGNEYYKAYNNLLQENGQLKQILGQYADHCQKLEIDNREWQDKFKVVKELLDKQVLPFQPSPFNLFKGDSNAKDQDSLLKRFGSSRSFPKQDTSYT